MLFDIVKALIDEERVSKYFISKELHVSWNSVHNWYRGVFVPNQKHIIALIKLYENLKEKKDAKSLSENK